jgi:hypothetical protein
MVKAVTKTTMAMRRMTEPPYAIDHFIFLISIDLYRVLNTPISELNNFSSGCASLLFDIVLLFHALAFNPHFAECPFGLSTCVPKLETTMYRLLWSIPYSLQEIEFLLMRFHFLH